jgi:hypothetical protein
MVVDPLPLLKAVETVEQGAATAMRLATMEGSGWPQKPDKPAACAQDKRVLQCCMAVLLLAQHPLEILKSRLEAGVKATPLCLAIIGWLADVPTEPFVADIRRSSEGDVLLRLSNEEAAEPLCTFFGFLKQVRVICQSLGLNEAQTARVATEVRQRLG